MAGKYQRDFILGYCVIYHHINGWFHWSIYIYEITLFFYFSHLNIYPTCYIIPYKKCIIFVYRMIHGLLMSSKLWTDNINEWTDNINQEIEKMESYSDSNKDAYVYVVYVFYGSLCFLVKNWSNGWYNLTFMMILIKSLYCIYIHCFTFFYKT